MIVFILLSSFYFIASREFHWFPNNISLYPIDEDLDQHFIWNMTENLSNIVYSAYDWSTGEIAKGRFFGSKGERKAADIIFKNFSSFGYDSSKVYMEKVENIDYPLKWIDSFLNITTKLEVTEQKLSVNNKSSGVETIVTEFIINPQWNNSLYNPFYDRKQLNHTFIENDLSLYSEIPYSIDLGPFNSSWFDTFLLNKTTNEIIFDNFSRFDAIEEFSFWLYDFVKQAYFDTFSYSAISIDEYILIEENRAFNPNADDTIPAWEPIYLIDNESFFLVKLLHIFTKQLQLVLWSQLHPQCKGIIRYDFSNDTYDMNLHRFSPIPIIYITGNLGKEIINDLDNHSINYTLCQQYNESVNSSNVIAEIDGVDNSKTVIVSCLYDSWWNQGTADSAIGMSIVLAIAKYMKELEHLHIKPYYKTKFIAFSGEEYGRVGARYYEAKHADESIELIIDVNQVGFDNPNRSVNPDMNNLTLQIWTNQPFDQSLNKSVNEIVKRSDYTEKTNISWWTRSNLLGGHVGNKDPFALNRIVKNRIKTVYFVKNHAWIYHHRDGLNHTEGDSMNYMNKSDIEITSEMILNVTVGLNPLVYTGVEIYISFILFISLLIIILLLIWIRYEKIFNFLGFQENKRGKRY